MVDDLTRARLLVQIDGKIHGIMEDLKAIVDDPMKWQEIKPRFIWLLYGFRRHLDFMRDFDGQMYSAMVSQMKMHMTIYLQTDSKVERETAAREIIHYLKNELKMSEFMYEGYMFRPLDDNTLQVTQ